MRIPYDILKARLGTVLDGTCLHRELTDLVFLSRSIVQSYLQNVRTSMIWLCQHQGISIEDLSYDCVAEAFRRDDAGKFSSLGSFAASLEGELEKRKDVEVFLAFRGFLTKIVDQHLARLFAQADPAGGKIFRNIKESVKKSHFFMLDHDIRGLVLRPGCEDSLDQHGPFPRDELARQLFVSVGKNRSTGDLLRVLHAVLVAQSLYRRSLPLTEVTLVFKRLFAQDLESEQTDLAAPLDGLSESDLEQIQGEVETVLRQKVLVTYVMKGKIGAEQARIIVNTFHDLLDDWVKTGEMNNSILVYLQRFVEIDLEEYKREYRPKMEYLLGIARTEFQARLMREL